MSLSEPDDAIAGALAMAVLKKLHGNSAGAGRRADTADALGLDVHRRNALKRMVKISIIRAGWSTAQATPSMVCL